VNTEPIAAALAEKYRIERRLGEGGMATVFGEPAPLNRTAEQRIQAGELYLWATASRGRWGDRPARRRRPTRSTSASDTDPRVTPRYTC